MHFLVNWALHTFGLDDGSGAWYLFWSGVCGDLFIIGAVITMYRHLNCHADGCRRLGLHPVHGTSFKVCRKHHPAGGNSVDHIHAAHRTG